MIFAGGFEAASYQYSSGGRMVKGREVAATIMVGDDLLYDEIASPFVVINAWRAIDRSLI